MLSGRAADRRPYTHPAAWYQWRAGSSRPTTAWRRFPSYLPQTFSRRRWEMTWATFTPEAPGEMTWATFTPEAPAWASSSQSPHRCVLTSFASLAPPSRAGLVRSTVRPFPTRLVSLVGFPRLPGISHFASLLLLPCSSSPEQTRLRWALLRFPPQAADLERPGPPQTFSRRRWEMTWATFTPEAPAWARPRVMPAPSPMANMPGSLVSSSWERVRREE